MCTVEKTYKIIAWTFKVHFYRQPICKPLKGQLKILCHKTHNPNI